VKRLIEAREKQITVDITGGEQRNSVSIIDHWPVLSIGWLPENKIKQVLSVQSR
jgi:hypothetical protein